MKSAVRLVLILLLFSVLGVQFATAGQVFSHTVSNYGQISMPTQSGKFYVDGITIKNTFGEPIRIQGFNAEEKDLALHIPDSFDWLKANGFNSIRLMLFWHRYEPTQGNYDARYFSYLDNVISRCQANGIYIILDFHHWMWSPYFTYNGGSGVGFPSWVVSGGGYADSPAGATACATDFYMNQGHGVFMRQQYWQFMQKIINRYKDYSCVWAYELINEPTVIKSASFTQQTIAGIMDFYEAVTQQIRQIDPSTIIVYHYINFNPNPNNYNSGVERKVPYPNIVWTRSWYDVAYGGYSPSDLAQVQARLTNIKNKFNGELGAPFIISEMGFLRSDYPAGTEASASAWIRDSFNTMRNIGLNNGYESYNWYVYNLGPSYGFWTGRNTDGTNTFVTSVLKEFLLQ